MTFFERFPKYLFAAQSWHPKKYGIAVKPAWRESFDLAGVDLLYVLGLGDGSAYTHLQDWLHENLQRKIVFFEEDPRVLAGLLESGTHLFDDPQVDFEIIEADTTLRFAQKYPASRIEVVANAGFSIPHFRKIKFDLLRKSALSSALFINQIYGHRLFDQFVQNVPRFQGAFYANGLKDAFEGMPAIICGAGPSLQAAIPILRAYEGRAIVIAGGSAIAALTSAGIQPHFGIALDPNVEEYHRFCNSFFFEGPLILSTRVFPGIFGTCNGPFGYVRSGLGGSAELWFEKELGLDGFSLAEQMSEESMSVTTLALSLAAHIGCKTIVLSGVDLAYTGGKRYAPGVASGVCSQMETVSAPKHACDRLLRRKDKTGKYLTTAVRWIMEAASLAIFAKKHPHIQWINATEKGLDVAGFENLSLENVFALHMQNSFDIRGKIAREIQLHPMPKIPEDLLRKLEDSMARTVGHLEILTGAQKGSKALAEWDLQEELAVQVLFSDMPIMLAQAEHLGVASCGWDLYLEIARHYTRSG